VVGCVANVVREQTLFRGWLMGQGFGFIQGGAVRVKRAMINAGILRFAQDADVKRATAAATARGAVVVGVVACG
jgi:hypothetical protein